MWGWNYQKFTEWRAGVTGDLMVSFFPFVALQHKWLTTEFLFLYNNGMVCTIL